MSGSEIDALASALFDTMLEDVVLGIALEEHKAGMRNRAVCAVCHTRCRLEEHINGGASSGLPGTPVSGTAGTGGGGSGNANGTTNGAKSEPIVLLDCLKCKRQVTPNRYAAHLATCLGLGNARRAGPRNAAGKARHYRPGTESGATTPIQRPGSLNGEDTTTATPAAKSKPSKKKKKPDAVEPTNGNNKREGAAPAKTTKTKKQKVGKAANGKPLASQPSELDGFATVSVASPSPSKPSSTLSRVPSKLQNSQTPASPSGSSVTTPSHTPQMPPATIPAAVPAPPRVVRGTGPPRPLLGRGPSVPRTAPVVLEKPPPPPTRQSSGRTEVDGDLDDLVDTASDSSDDS